MSLVFDTGLPRSMRELLVGAIGAALDDLRRPAKYLSSIVTLPRASHGPDDEAFLGEIARQVAGRLPCVAIANADASSSATSEDALDLEDTIEVVVYVVSGNQRGKVDGRLFVDAAAAVDDTKDPGVFAIFEHVTERLQGANLGVLGLQAPRRVNERHLETFDDVTIWFQTYHVDVSRSINPDRDATTVMTSIEAKHKGTGIPDATSLDPLVDTVTPLAQ